MNALMLEATRLTRAHRLDDATALIQRMLRGELDQGGSPAARPAPLPRFYGETRSGDREFESLSWTCVDAPLGARRIFGLLAA